MDSSHINDFAEELRRMVQDSGNQGTGTTSGSNQSAPGNGVVPMMLGNTAMPSQNTAGRTAWTSTGFSSATSSPFSWNPSSSQQTTATSNPSTVSSNLMRGNTQLKIGGQQPQNLQLAGQQPRQQLSLSPQVQVSSQAQQQARLAPHALADPMIFLRFLQFVSTVANNSPLEDEQKSKLQSLNDIVQPQVKDHITNKKTPMSEQLTKGYIGGLMRILTKAMVIKLMQNFEIKMKEQMQASRRQQEMQQAQAHAQAQAQKQAQAVAHAQVQAQVHAATQAAHAQSQGFGRGTLSHIPTHGANVINAVKASEKMRQDMAQVKDGTSSSDEADKKSSKKKKKKDKKDKSKKKKSRKKKDRERDKDKDAEKKDVSTLPASSTSPGSSGTSTPAGESCTQTDATSTAPSVFGSSLVATSVASSGSSMTPMTAGSSRSVTGTPSIDDPVDFKRINDVTALAGVDMKRESVHILAEMDEHEMEEAEEAFDAEIQRLIVNPSKLKEIMLDVASKNHMARVMDDCLLLTGIALQDRMKCCLEAMRVLSQQRADEKKESAPYKITRDVKRKLRQIDRKMKTNADAAKRRRTADSTDTRGPGTGIEAAAAWLDRDRSFSSLSKSRTLQSSTSSLLDSVRSPLVGSGTPSVPYSRHSKRDTNTIIGADVINFLERDPYTRRRGGILYRLQAEGTATPGKRRWARDNSILATPNPRSRTPAQKHVHSASSSSGASAALAVSEAVGLRSTPANSGADSNSVTS